MSDYTPTLGEAEGRYSAGRLLLDGERDSGTATERYDEFYRMVAAIEHEAAARALEGAAEDVEIDMGRGFTVSDDHVATANAEAWLRARAAEIRSGHGIDKK